jgi:hypothetical protein
MYMYMLQLKGSHKHSLYERCDELIYLHFQLQCLSVTDRNSKPVNVL